LAIISGLAGFVHCKHGVILIQLTRKTVLSVIKMFIKEEEEEKNSLVAYSHKLSFAVPS
jgi:hypothetical protein